MMGIFRLYLKIIVLLGCIYPSLYAQKHNFVFDHITVEDGLANANVISILQDSEGFMWFGTEDGLSKFDGISFESFSENIETPGFMGNYIFDVIEDSDTNLWVATSYGLNLYNRKTRSFKAFMPKELSDTAISDVIIRTVIEDRNGLIWIGTQSGKINVYDKKKNTFSIFSIEGQASINKNKSKIGDLLEDNLGNIWVLYSDGGTIDIISANRDRVSSIDLSSFSTNNAPIKQRAAIQDKSNNIWITTMGNGLFKITNEEGHYNIKLYHSNNSDTSGLPGNSILSIVEDPQDSAIWLGIENKGLTHFNYSNNTFINAQSVAGNSKSLANNSVWSIYIDKDHALWSGTYASGINYMNSALEQFHHVESNVIDKKSLSNNIVTSFLVDHKGFLWVGTDGGGLNKQDPKTGEYTHYKTSNSNISSDAILGLFEDSKNRLWITTWDGGINLLDRNKNRFIVYNSNNSNFTGNNFASIVEDKNGTIWAGSFWGNDGLCYFDENENNFNCYHEENSSIADNTIYKILPGKDGYLWVGTHNGFMKFDTATKKRVLYGYKLNDSTSLSNSNVHDVIETKDSLIWLATANGLNAFNRKTEKFKRYNKGLYNFPDDNFSSLEEDNDGNLWISYKNGLIKFNPKTNDSKIYKSSEGLQKGSFIRTSSYKSPSGEFYFGGTEGYNYFYPEEIIERFLKPEMYFSNLKIFNKDVIPETQDSPLKEGSITYLDTLNLSYKHSVFTIEYGAINFLSPEKVSFAFMLEGFEKDWNYVGPQRSATYTNLDPGRYVFKVKIPNNKGVANEEGIALVINISPPFYLTWWFRALSLLILASAIIGFFYIRIQSVKRRNIELEKSVKERTKEINEQNELLYKQSNELREKNTLLEKTQTQILEQSEELRATSEELLVQKDELEGVNNLKDRLFSIIAHDLRSPFTSLLGFADLLQMKYDDYDEATRKKMIGQIKNASDNVYELLEQLLTWSIAQRGGISFNPESHNLIDTVKQNISLVENQAGLKHIRVNLVSDSNNITLNYDPDLILTVIRNLLSNAIKFTHKGGVIYINAVEEVGRVVVSVKDSGVGISQENIDKLFRKDSIVKELGTDNEKGTGLGLTICKDFVEKHNGKIWVESKLGDGTTFSFSLPV